MQEIATEFRGRSRTRAGTNKSAACNRFHASLDEIQQRFQSKLEELYTDFKQLAADLRATNQR